MPITWRNIQGPNFEGANKLRQQSVEGIDRGLNKVANLAGDYHEGQVTDATDAALLKIRGLGNLKDYEAARQNGLVGQLTGGGSLADATKVASAFDARKGQLQNDFTQQNAFDAAVQKENDKPFILSAEQELGKLTTGQQVTDWFNNTENTAGISDVGKNFLQNKHFARRADLTATSDAKANKHQQLAADDITNTRVSAISGKAGAFSKAKPQLREAYAATGMSPAEIDANMKTAENQYNSRFRLSEIDQERAGSKVKEVTNELTARVTANKEADDLTKSLYPLNANLTPGSPPYNESKNALATYITAEIPSDVASNNFYGGQPLRALVNGYLESGVPASDNLPPVNNVQPGEIALAIKLLKDQGNLIFDNGVDKDSLEAAIRASAAQKGNWNNLATGLRKLSKKTLDDSVDNQRSITSGLGLRVNKSIRDGDFDVTDFYDSSGNISTQDAENSIKASARNPAPTTPKRQVTTTVTNPSVANQNSNTQPKVNQQDALGKSIESIIGPTTRAKKERETAAQLKSKKADIAKLSSVDRKIYKEAIAAQESDNTNSGESTLKSIFKMGPTVMRGLQVATNAIGEGNSEYYDSMKKSAAFRDVHDKYRALSVGPAQVLKTSQDPAELVKAQKQLDALDIRKANELKSMK